MCQSCCLEGGSAAVLRPGGLLPTASENRTDTANHRLHVLDRSAHMVAEEDPVEAEAEVGAVVADSEMKTGVIAQEATRPAVVLRLGGAGARATIAGALVEAHHRGGGSVTRALPEAAVVEGGVALAIRTRAIGATAGIAAAVATVVDADASCMKQTYLFGVKSHGIRRPFAIV
jgi:hypothetical protein